MVKLQRKISGPDFVQENQAIKCQKLDGGRSKQVVVDTDFLIAL